MSTNLTKKQKGFVKDYLKTNNATEAALNNYDVKDREVAGSMGSENLQKPLIKNAIQESLPDDLLAQVHLEGLSATKRSGTGGMKIGIGANGEVNDFGHTEIDEPDYATRHKYLDSAYKIKGTYAPEKKLTVNVDIETSTEDLLLAEQLKQLERNNDSQTS